MGEAWTKMIQESDARIEQLRREAIHDHRVNSVPNHIRRQWEYYNRENQSKRERVHRVATCDATQSPARTVIDTNK